MRAFPCNPHAGPEGDSWVRPFEWCLCWQCCLCSAVTFRRRGARICACSRALYWPARFVARNPRSSPPRVRHGIHGNSEEEGASARGRDGLGCGVTDLDADDAAVEPVAEQELPVVLGLAVASVEPGGAFPAREEVDPPVMPRATGVGQPVGLHVLTWQDDRIRTQTGR